MNHKQFVASIPPEDRVRLTRASDRRGLAHLAGHAAVIGALGAEVAAGVPGWWALMLPLGIALVFLFTLEHETTHRTPFRSGWLNDAAGHACGLVLVLPATWFRLFHQAHHRFTQDPARDPELADPKPETRAQYAWHLTGLPVWRDQIATLLRNAAGRCDDPFVPRGRRRTVVREARAMLAGYALLLGVSLVSGSALLLWVWILPILLGQPFLRLYLLAEHGGCAFVADMLANSRTTFTNGLVRRLAWNMPYHAEHHAYPAVPFHQLPALHRLARPHLAETSPGYGAFHRRYAGGLRG